MSKKIENLDIRFFIGVALTIGGQYFSLKPVSFLGLNLESNALQLTGIILTLWHIILIIYIEIMNQRRKADDKD